MVGQLEFINDNKKSFKIIIEAYENKLEKIALDLAGETTIGIIDEIIGSQLGNTHENHVVVEIPPKSKTTFKIELPHMEYVTHYSIRGDSYNFAEGSNCAHLCIDKNYKIIFSNDMTGITCVSEETT